MKKLLPVVLIMILVLVMSGVALADTGYTDVSGLSQPMQEAIAKATELRLFEGYEGGAFQPEQGISRGEFAAVLVRLSGLADQAPAAAAQKSAFSDVYEGHWAEGYINLAVAQGLLQGRGNGVFDPRAQVSQSEAAVALLRYAGFSASQLGGYPADSDQLIQSLGLTADLSFEGPKAASRAGTAYMASKITGVRTAMQGEPAAAYFYNGQAQPIFAKDEAITEVVYVETPVDTDQDGKLDLIQVFIKRPGPTGQGMKVPAIYQALPYETGTTDIYYEDSYNEHAKDAQLPAATSTKTTEKDWAYRADPGQVKAVGYTPDHQASAEEQAAAAASAASAAAWENTYSTGNYDYWLVRGYACVFAGGLGTRGSDGIATTASEAETAAFAAVVKWLNGQAQAYLDPMGQAAVKADWCTGKVAMSGRSYGGSTAFAVAATGVAGLETIIPLAGIANWYDYYRSQGIGAGAVYYPGDEASTLSYYTMSRMLDEADYAAVKGVYEAYYQQMIRDEDRANGDYNRFWDERNYAAQAKGLNCSALLIHGLNDFNVRTKQFDLMYQAFQDSGQPVRLILHQGAHMTPNAVEGLDYYGILSQWLAYWLYGVENQVLADLPAATVQSNVDLSWQAYESWGSGNSRVFQAGSGAAAFSGDLTLAGFDPEAEWAEYFSESMYAWEKAIATDSTEASVGYGFQLSQDLHISGTVQVQVRAALDQPTGILSAMLVDTAEGLTALQVNDGEAVPTAATGKNIWLSGDLPPLPQTQFVKESCDYKIITRGWMDVQNRDSIHRVSSISPGQYYTFTLDLQPIDYTVQAGHTLSLILYSADAQVTYWPATVTNFTVDNSKTWMKVPVGK